MRHLATVLLITSATGYLPAAVPLRWTVETSRVNPASFEAYQGETLELEAALQSYGKPLEAPLNYSFFWQTNGMGNTYWEKKVVVGSRSRTEEDSNSSVNLNLQPQPTNVLFATFTPSMDVGAKVYNCFIGSPSNIYRAAFQLRLRPSPGAVPNELELPRKHIDFAQVEVENAPWAEQGDVDALAASVAGKLDQADVVAPSKDAKPGQAADALGVATNYLSMRQSSEEGSGYLHWMGRNLLAGMSLDVFFPGFVRVPGWDCFQVGASYDTNPSRLPDYINSVVEPVAAAATAAQEEVGAVRSVLAGEDFRITITNYDSKVNAPELSMEARYSDGTTQRWETVWTETNGLARTKRETLSEVSSNHYDKAESDARYKAWGQNDGYTGEAAPEGFAQYSGPGGLIIGADAGWKNYVSAGGGSYWIWRGNGNVTTSQATGTLDILDSDGNAALSLVKGDKTLESAAAASIAKSADGAKDIVTIVYNVKAEEAPVLEFSAELKPALWFKQTDDGFPGTVAWTSEGNVKWTAVVTLPANGRGFFRATYWKGKENYIRSNKSMALDGGIIIDGVKFSLKVVEINGVKVLGVE